MNCLRRLSAAALAGSTALMLTGCTVEPGGIVGLSVDDEGRPRVVVAVCQGFIDGVTIWTEQDGKEQDLGRWARREPVTGTADLLLADPAPEWATEQPLVVLPTGVSLHVYGWTGKSRWSAPGPTFTADDVSQLRGGEVWYQRYDTDTDEFAMASVPAEGFGAKACEDF